jgi:hypothetical protein
LIELELAISITGCTFSGGSVTGEGIAPFTPFFLANIFLNGAYLSDILTPASKLVFGDTLI